MIDNASEAGASQYTGDLWGLYLVIEEPDGNFLDEHGLPDGNLYKMDTASGTGPGGGDLHNQGPTQATDNADLVAFRSAYESSPNRQWWEQNLDLEEYFSYRAILEGIHHYDIAAGKNYYYYHNPETDKWSVLPWDLDLTWADNMHGDGNEPFKSRVLPTFSTEYQNRLRELRDLLLNSEQAGQLIDEMAALIYKAGQPSWVDIDRRMWDYNPVMIDSSRVPIGNNKAGQGRFYAGNPGAGINIPSPGGFAGMMQKMKNYLSSRSSWIDNTLLSDDRNSLVPGTPSVAYVGAAGFAMDGLRFRSSNFAGRAGGTFSAIQWRIADVTPVTGSEKNYEIDAAWESDEITSFAEGQYITIPATAVTPGRVYRVRVKMKDSNGRWSHWSSSFQFVAGEPNDLVKSSLRITEVHYNPDGPPPPDTGEALDNDEFEFIELKNIGAQAINLQGVTLTFSSSYTYTFDELQLAPGQHVVVPRNTAAFVQRYAAAGLTLAPEYGPSGKLDNGGQRIILTDKLAQTVLDFTYDDNLPWHPETDGSGKTLTIVDPDAPAANWNTAAAWKASRTDDGTPGADEVTLADGSVVINEVLAHTDLSPVGDWIELYNASDHDIDISGWFLSDSDKTSKDLCKFRIPDNTILASGDYVYFTQFEHFGTTVLGPSGFGLSELGDDVVLSSATPAGALSGYRASESFDASDKEYTLGRHILPDSGAVRFTLLAEPTRGSANSSPRIAPVVINEVMFSPPAGRDEYIELRNTTNSIVYLYDPSHPQNTWKIGGIAYTFAQGQFLLPYQFALVTPIAADIFRAKYAVPDEVKIFSLPYTGQLSDSGETVRLLLPGAPEIIPPYEVPYYPADVFAYTPNASGHLARRDSLAFGDAPANWDVDGTYGSPGLANFDHQAPSASIHPITSPSDSAIVSAVIEFSEPVLGFGLADLTLTRDGGGNLLNYSFPLSTEDNRVFTLSGLDRETFIAGEYTLTVGNAFTLDRAGNRLAAPTDVSFTITQTVIPGSDADDSFEIRHMGAQIEVAHHHDGQHLFYYIPAASAAPLHIAGSSGNDELKVYGDVPMGFQFDAGDGEDVVVYLDGAHTLSAVPDGLEFIVISGGTIQSPLPAIAALRVDGGVFIASADTLALDDLILAGEGIVDLLTGNLVVKCEDSASAAALRRTLGDAIIDGRLTTSQSRPEHRLAVAVGADLTVGDGLEDHHVLVKYTWTADATFDGKVDTADFAELSKGYVAYQLNKTNPDFETKFTSGDFDMDGAVGTADFALLSKAYVQSQIEKLQGGTAMAASAGPDRATSRTKVQKVHRKPLARRARLR